jgi:excisionase family DNA binding protein
MEKIVERSALSVDEGCTYLGIGRAHFYRLMDQGEIHSFHIGRRRLVLREHLDKFIRERLAEAGQRQEPE